MSDFSVVIPARMHSTRLPQKMLLNIAGLPLIVHTAKQAAKSKAKRIIVATDHDDILKLCNQYNIEAYLTSEKHTTGTDRLSEVVKLLKLDDQEIIINVQGDEPLIDPKLINQLGEFIHEKQTAIATIAHPIYSIEEIFSPNVVKVVLDKFNNALYFSRATIPFYRDGYKDKNELKLPTNINILRHIGIYAYSVGFLKNYPTMPDCNLEHVECLEQLRALYNGYKIAVFCSEIHLPPGVDTLDDLERVRQIVAKY